MFAALFVLSAVSLVTAQYGDGEQSSPGYDEQALGMGGSFIPVSNITGFPETATVGVPLTLTGTVTPNNATAQTITWSVKNAGTTGANIGGNILSAVSAGSVIVTAKVNYDPGNGFVTVSAGANHTLAVKEDGTLWAWGSNTYGQLGDGTTVDKNRPVQIGTATNWEAVAAGQFHSVAINAAGQLYAWGYNNYGQLGDGTTTTTPTLAPQLIVSTVYWTAASAGYSHTVAMDSSGILYAWGGNSYGQLGDGSNTNSSTPSIVTGSHTWKSFSAGNYHTAAIKSDDTLWTWGSNTYGQLGLGALDTTDKNTPTAVPGTGVWTVVSAGSQHTLGVKNDGTLWGWGGNGFGQLGQGNSLDNYKSPTRIGTATDWTSASAGDNFTAVMKNNGTLWACGRANSGQLGSGNAPSYVANLVPSGTDYDWAAVSAGGNHVAAIKTTDNSLWMWGSNQYGQIGDYSVVTNGATRPNPTEIEVFKKDFNITISPAPAVTTSSLPDGTVGTAYSETLASEGIASPVTWSLDASSGPLPEGLTLSADGTISGTPSQSGYFTLVVKASNASGSITATRTLDLDILAAPSDDDGMLIIILAAVAAAVIAIAAVYMFVIRPRRQ